jgi:tetratricopeptide (TPR) repeat protein
MMLKTLLTAVFGVLMVSAALPTASAMVQSGADRSAEAGWQALQAGDGDRAAAVFREALERNPRDPALHLGAGLASHLLGRETDATQSLKRALELEPKLVVASLVLGLIQYQSGDVDAAIHTYEKALTYAPANLEIRGNLDRWRKEAALHQTLQQRNDGRFSIVFEGRSDQALATRAIAVLDAAYWRIGKAIGGYPSDTISVTLYTEQQFRDLTRAPDWSNGLYDGRIRLPVRGASQNLKEFDRALNHELTHAMVTSLAPRGVPAWLHEGLATYFEPQDPAAAAKLLKSAPVIPISKLPLDFTRLNDEQALVAYIESLVAADVLMQRVGPRTAILLQALDAGQGFEQAFDQVGVPFADFQADVTRRFK